jgi:modulator of drug activity B
MKKVFIINGHQYYPFSEGKANKAFEDKLRELLKSDDFEIRYTATEKDYDVEEEMEKWQWADLLFVQSPLNWMGIPWSFKKYLDEVLTAGMMGTLSAGDGRSSEAPKKNYGLGGLLTSKYMFSFTANAPSEAFSNPDEKFFCGLSEDQLLLPMHLNMKWFGLEPLKTFFAYDVMKNANIPTDLIRFENHIKKELINKL